MTNTREGASEFYELMRSAGELEELTQEYDDAGKENKNRDELLKRVYAHKQVFGERVPDSPDGLDYKEALEYAEGIMKGTLYQIATRNAKKNLGSLIESSDEKGIEALIGDKEILRHAPKGYEDWFEKYSAVREIKDLRNRAGEGKLKKEEEHALRSQIARIDAEKAREIAKKVGLSKNKQDSYAAYAARAALIYASREEVIEVIDEDLKKSEEYLRKYEKAGEKDAKGFLEGAMRNMLKQPAGTSRRALQYLEAIRKKEKKKK